jgi:hypothetical protein
MLDRRIAQLRFETTVCCRTPVGVALASSCYMDCGVSSRDQACPPVIDQKSVVSQHSRLLARSGSDPSCCAFIRTLGLGQGACVRSSRSRVGRVPAVKGGMNCSGNGCLLLLVKVLVGFGHFSGLTWPQDPSRRVRFEKWCRLQFKSTQETNLMPFRDIFWAPI